MMAKEAKRYERNLYFRRRHLGIEALSVPQRKQTERNQRDADERNTEIVFARGGRSGG